jgi:hypothetical protein
VIELQPCRAARSTGNTTGEHLLREGRGHADDVQVQVGRRIEENVILAGRRRSLVETEMDASP